MTKYRERRTKNEALLTADDVRSVLDFDAETGNFYWRQSLQGHVKAGQLAGSIRQRYRKIEIKNVRYGAHRLAWLVTFDEWPDGDLDHINGDCLDNRIANLRVATISQNMANKRRASHNKSGVKGVVWEKKSRNWRVTVRSGGKVAYSGWFKTLDEAREAYRCAAQRLHGEFSRAE